MDHQAEIYLKTGDSTEHLNALLQGVVACNKEEVLAGQLGIEIEWKLMKEQFTDALQSQYGLDPETVEAVCALRNPNYTVAVENILAGRRYDDMSAYGGNVVTETDTEVVPEAEDVSQNGDWNPEEMEDLLPEEEAIIEQMQQEDAVSSEEGSETTTEGERELYSGSVEDGAVNFVE